VEGGKSGPKICRDGFFQARLVVFDHEEVVAAIIENLLAQVTLAEDGVAGDQASLQDDCFQELQGSFVHVGLAPDFMLTEHESRSLI
jgi:hypothetical protein